MNNSRIKKLVLLVFMLLSGTHLTAILLNKLLLTDITKVLVIPFLMGYLILHLNKNHKGFYLSLFALGFCWLGDILLIFTERHEVFFLLGLAAFLVGHLFYIFTFKRMADQNSVNKPLQQVFLLIPLIYAVSLLLMLYPNLGEMQYPVTLYAIVIAFMCSAAMRRWQKTSLVSFNYVLTGAALFLISDTLIAINKFYEAFQYAGFFIMLTYIAAQYLIVVGLIKHYKPKDTVI